MEINKDLVKELREKTNAGVMDCKKALAKSEGNLESAMQFLKTQGMAVAQKKASREASEGLVFSYIHMKGKMGVLLEINCETDFVARTEVFQALAKDVALQIAGAHPAPRYVSKNEISLDKVSELSRQFEQGFSGKSPEAIKKIVEGKLEKYYAETCLLEQPFIKDSNFTVQQLIQSKIAELGENIIVRRFVRYQLGEGQA